MKVVRLSASRTGRLYPQECTWYSFSLGAESTLKNQVTPLGIDPGTVRLVAQRLNHYATPSPHLYAGIYNYVPETSHVSTVYRAAAALYLQSVLHVMLLRPCNMFCSFTLALSAVRLQCPLCLGFAVP
jgi:hypothetical protein